MFSDPVLLFFFFGFFAGLVKSDIKMPTAIFEFLTLMLLVSIGMKGGVQLSNESLLDLLPKILALILVGSLIPVVLYPILKFIGRFPQHDAASIAAHYGSVSVGTFAVVIAFLETRNIEYESYVALFVVVLEVPAIIVGIILAKGFHSGVAWKNIAHDVFLGKSIMLLIGGLLIGWLSGKDGLKSVNPFFMNLFPGILCLFLLEMGLIVSKQVSSLIQHGVFLLFFGILVPMLLSIVGIQMGVLMNMTVGGSMVLGTLLASASYIAVPAAMRISVPSANPTLSLTASLGVTFPFNVMIGIPFLYYPIATYMV